MKSVKKGRGPSLVGGMGKLLVGVFGLIWTIAAAAMTRGAGIMGVIFPLFGVVFIISAVAGAIYDFRNATSDNRYSEFVIVDSSEEPDPLNERFGTKNVTSSRDEETAYCPYCGTKVKNEYDFCLKCGKGLP